MLYLSDPSQYTIWLNSTQQGLYTLNRIPDIKGETDWGKNYHIFNSAAIVFRDKYGFDPHELDWVLSFISAYVESGEDYFLIEEEEFDVTEISVSIDDEAELEEVVGEPMELEVMRWAPTNEMGVIALFTEFRKKLGFPIIEIIRSQFPDAVVFESTSKGYRRRYIEFEFRSSGYKSHLKSKRNCHYVICWQHDWKECPIQVIELKNKCQKSY